MSNLLVIQPPTPITVPVISMAPGLFYKVDAASVIFTKTGAGTVSIKAGSVISLANLLYPFIADTAVQMPSLTAGTDYAIYLCNDGTVRADASFSAPSGFSTSTSRQIGGFHYAPGGNAAAQSGGDTTPAINPYSLWDLKWRPSAPDPRGMALVSNWFWSDIYLLGVNHITDGTSKSGATIADGSSPPKIPLAFGGSGSSAYGDLNWWTAAEVLSAYGKRLPNYTEFGALSYGTTENNSRGNDPVTTGFATTNAGSTLADNLFTSAWGVIQATGVMNQWGINFGGPYAAASWANGANSRGQQYEQPNAAAFGGNWVDGGNAGSRYSNWNNAPSGSYSSFGARGLCDHLHHV